MDVIQVNARNQRLLLTNGRIYTGRRVIDNGCLLVGTDGRIEAVGEPEEISEAFMEAVLVLDLQGKRVLPGLIDVHVHGGNGFQVMDGTFEGLDGMSRFHAAHGTTSFLATTDSASEQEILKALRCADEAASRGLDGAELLGVHLEGPFLHPGRGGAQDKRHLRSATKAELRRHIEASGNRIKLATLAPEIEGGLEAVDLLAGLGITVSIGHSDATHAQVLEAIRRGVSHTTHHFNGMSPFHHRDPGVAGSGLICGELTTELIPDGIHVHPAVVKLLFDIKGAHKVCMITDAVQQAGLPDGDYGEIILKDRQVWLKDGSSLAGSTLTMIQGLKNVLSYTGYALEVVLPSFTEVPARQSGVADRKGKLEAGKDADFLIVDDDLAIRSTYVGGREVYAI
ncbi:N-acetylglucosamine-6-phosphate deacetylase [Paenibacillus sp. PAMC21692]|uniref:N-acetylglucosamine-6-phosphate deacetylase n=1 Tax=Paenibacillus sp. PAMC21692 TaxID=2762320 RepID=UPI00164D954B|nr:N-acetylglucosamine-6-phosphate deacetylase [Paenibacillus sp. PAMC21692]QNK54914.1 N-acetylglucosamine-6-phosphate deacetylase [Paenibacillus sp. PAMC21692]